MQVNHQIKRLLFQYYALLTFIIFAAAILLLVFRILHWEVVVTIAGGVLTFALAVQKQQLEETQLFKELFEQFNGRYDEMNDGLNQILNQPTDLPLTKDEKKKLFKYFNLCGEEFLYFEKGFIYPEVWQAWNNGMIFFRQNPRIKKVWDEDLKNDSYYGLKFEDNKDSN